MSEQLITGLDFEYRLAGNEEAKRQIFLYGETVHGARSGDVDCSDLDNKETEICKVARFESPTPDAQFAIFRKATTLEGLIGIRAELFSLREGSSAPSRFYVKGQLGFLTTANNGGDIIDMHHVAVGYQADRRDSSKAATSRPATAGTISFSRIDGAQNSMRFSASHRGR